MCEQLRTSATIHERIARIHQHLRTSTSICEILRTATRMRGGGNTEAYQYRHGDMQQHGNTEIQIHTRRCGNAEMQTISDATIPVADHELSGLTWGYPNLVA